MAEGLKVEGLKELLSALRKIDPALKIEIKALNLESAKIVRMEAMRRVPVGKTGKLQRSIKALASQRKGRVVAGSKPVPYAGVIHFGWPKRHIRPQPFLFRALDRKRLEVFRTWKKGVDRVIDNAMRQTRR